MAQTPQTVRRGLTGVWVMLVATAVSGGTLGGLPTGTFGGRASSVPQAVVCSGDCDGNGEVTIDELITLVNIALGNSPITACPTSNVDAQISINEIVAAINKALEGCGGSPVPTATPTETPTPTPTTGTHMVVVAPGGALQFSPPDLTIQVGDTVEWTWASSGHTVVSGNDCTADGQFCSPNDADCAQAPTSSSGAMYSHRFTAAGTYPYFCIPHCALGMVGTITVQ